MTNGKDAETRKDDLRTGKPYWLTTPGTSVPYRADPGRDRFDVIVVGAGISGALTAEALTRQGRSVLILEAEQRLQEAKDQAIAAAEKARHAAIWSALFLAVSSLVAAVAAWMGAIKGGADRDAGRVWKGLTRRR